MDQAIVNPQELGQFASYLDQFKNDLTAHLRLLNGKFQTLGQTWRDQQREKFSKEYEAAVRVILRFLETVENEHLPYLRRKVEEASKYLYG